MAQEHIQRLQGVLGLNVLVLLNQSPSHCQRSGHSQKTSQLSRRQHTTWVRCRLGLRSNGIGHCVSNPQFWRVPNSSGYSGVSFLAMERKGAHRLLAAILAVATARGS